MVLNISKSNQRLDMDKISIGVKINKNHVNCELYNLVIELIRIINE